jgi:formylglycine-generating enzyme required for sulfatase activity
MPLMPTTTRTGKRLPRQTRLMVFLSTPYSGASMANWIQYLGKLLRTTVSVEELEAHHPRLRELNNWYRDHVESLGIQTFVYYEKLPTTGLLVVDETTANPGIPGVRPIPVDEDHCSIFITDLMAHNLALAGRCAAQPEVVVSETLKATVRRALVERTQDPRADLRARIAAGLALGELGDPRFARRDGPYGTYLLPPLIEIPGGTYYLGSDEGLDADEAPVHSVVLAPFALGQFPVTNAEWFWFMQAGGYEEERWWDTEEARAWRRGEGTAEGPKQQWREIRKSFQDHLDRISALHLQGRLTLKQAEDWEVMARMSDEDFEALLDERYPAGLQTQPDRWNDDAYKNPTQPVVGICWFEARAYCVWLSAQTGQLVTAP